MELLSAITFEEDVLTQEQPAEHMDDIITIPDSLLSNNKKIRSYFLKRCSKPLDFSCLLFPPFGIKTPTPQV